ncbi:MULTISPECIES: RlmE family RNA methyltransferase [Nitrosomonas]|uniref:Ribosomal RNA large subunit methyltransferase E n=2 Tax=Nitrosomonas eutropha TaxID=916 RepID=RLME_NITEC|nr:MULTISPECIES: RlmE family RNA methyltransferase [Nitrosomonas]Q0AHC6.1 RecName: Full=Ribosomal RNA large subunit methyltransferase E; AltName: Full=23S rRNA Um2552 methyltransferase; AltName: Full=rRNA (uridine-2'-O-)-methyltransferase [Nitrosomonas eutropha C91]ABI59256.1 23S rRNA Um-2552 2'-O-methyltransferase [Nitrosomonas eutropha C91]MXS81271.1 RlmE family RNA methyltransferase [Nitrosomonas sp. GH22]PXV81034.1 23S rRNA Um-2552 2'-O-methyltransferase [Nitrosomonas eutropha]SCX21786.1 2
MKSARTSRAWIKAHINDNFVRKANHEGYRSRAAYKLQEIAERDALFSPGMTVVDLGASPGSWSQVALESVGPTGKVFALDMLDMQSLPGATFIQGDFRENGVLAALEKVLDGKRADLVISDMSPNLTGIRVSDQAHGMYLAELALMFCREHLNPGENFLVKVFQGSDFEAFRQLMQADFAKVVIRKPKASRDRSKELYLLGLEKII